MAGKETNNCFTPLQKLSDLNIAANTNCNDTEDSSNDNVKKIQSHPAFGFKAGLIRVIGNLVYKHEKNQNLVSDNFFSILRLQLFLIKIFLIGSRN